MYEKWFASQSKYVARASDVLTLYLMLGKINYTEVQFYFDWRTNGVIATMILRVNSKNIAIKDFVSSEILDADEHLVAIISEELNEFPSAEARLSRNLAT